MEMEYLPMGINNKSMILNEGKALLTSATFWTALVQAVAGVLMVYSAAYPDAGFLLVLKSFFDVYLRYQTSQPITGIVSK